MSLNIQELSAPSVTILLDKRLADLRARGAARAANTPFYHNRLRAYFGSYKPHQITANLVSNYWETRREAPASLREELLELRAALRMGFRHDLIAKVPYIEVPRRRPPRERFLTRKQAQALVRAASLNHVKLYILIGMTTGARKSAILGLTWDRVDLARGRVDFTDPGLAETNKRRAIVPIHANIVDILRSAKQDATTEFVIEYKGAPIKDIRTAFAKAATKAGLPWATPHTLKHSVISWLAEAGYTVDQISDMTATHPGTVRRVYRKVSPEYLSELAESLAQGLIS